MPATNPRFTKLSAAEKVVHSQKVSQALELRRAGVTLGDIADRLGWKTPQAVQNAIRRALESVKVEAVDELRTMMAARLDGLLVTYYPPALRGDTKAAEIVLRIEAQRARLFGLDAPTKTEVTGTDGGPIEVVEVDTLADRILQIAGPRRADPEVVELDAG